MTLAETKEFMTGAEWKSIAPELRPSSLKNPDGSIKPFYLSRTFKYFEGDKFELQILNFADPFGKVGLAKLVIKGQILWKGDHPIAKDAYNVDFIADEAYNVTPLIQGFADLLNQVAAKGFDQWKVNSSQNIFKKAFAPFGLAEGQVFSECDLIYIYNNMLFWGARNVDGRGFDKEENRPTNLQIPLTR